MGNYPQIPATIKERRKLLKTELKKYQNKRYICPALGIKVRVTPNSIVETAQHAAKSAIATKLALRLPYVIKNATIVLERKPPKPNKQTNAFHFRELAILKCGIRGLGTAKLTVGYVYENYVVEYCITDMHYITK